VAKEVSGGIPAFISTDQEGGMVVRAYSGATHFPSNMAMNAAGLSSADLERVGEMVGVELRALGINVNHAPVLDVNNNAKNPVIGVRSYSDDPTVVGELGSAYTKGLQRSRVIANAKHFPGHGDTHVDSHLGLPTVDHGLDRLEALEFAPFKKAISEGLDGVMTAHILFPALDKERPATLSPVILTDLLRGKMGFDGLIFTDSMSMKAISKEFGMERGCVMAINAGVDVLCICATREGQANCMEEIFAAVKSGEISMATIDKAVERIIRYKEKYGLWEELSEPVEKYPAHDKFADEISEKSMTLIKNDGVLPLSKNADNSKIFAISTPVVRANIADDTLVKLVTFAEKCGKALGCGYAEIKVDPQDEEIATVLEKAKNAETVVYASYGALQNQGQIKLYEALAKAGKKIVAVSLRVPYDQIKMPGAAAQVAAYEYTNRSVDNVIKALTGEIPFSGKLPVEVPSSL